MNILKLGRGNFFGIIIPGSFLLFNALVIYSEIVVSKAQLLDIQEWKGKGADIVFFFIMSYVIGIGLRLISPKYLEWVAAIIKISFKFSWAIVRGKKVGTFRDMLKDLYLKYAEPFPYMSSFYSNQIKLVRKATRDFYTDLLENEFDNTLENMNNSIFINDCKTCIRRGSEALADEILYNEGLVRFLSGVVYAMALTIALFGLSGIGSFVIYVYMAVAVIFLFSIKRIRRKEVFIILSAFAHVSLAEKRENERS